MAKARTEGSLGRPSAEERRGLAEGKDYVKGGPGSQCGKGDWHPCMDAKE